MVKSLRIHSLLEESLKGREIVLETFIFRKTKSSEPVYKFINSISERELEDLKGSRMEHIGKKSFEIEKAVYHRGKVTLILKNRIDVDGPSFFQISIPIDQGIDLHE